MFGKKFLILYICITVISIGFILFGAVFYQKVINDNVDTRIELSKDNQEYWQQAPYGSDSHFRINMTFFNWENHEEINTYKKTEVTEVVPDFMIDEVITFTEMDREDHPKKNTELLKLEMSINRNVIGAIAEEESSEASSKESSGDSSSSPDPSSSKKLLLNGQELSNASQSHFRQTQEKDATITLLNIGAIKLWSYLKNSPSGSNAIKILYSQLHEIGNKFYDFIQEKAIAKVTTLEEFKAGSFFKDVSFESSKDEILANMYSKYRMSFTKSPTFFRALLECDAPGDFDLEAQSTKVLCNTFKELFSLDNLNFLKLISNFKIYLKDTLLIKPENKVVFSYEQWGQGSYLEESVFNNNSTSFQKELFVYAKEKYPQTTFQLTVEQVQKLANYLFAIRNSQDSTYIAEGKDKSFLFNKRFVDSIYRNNIDNLAFPQSKVKFDITQKNIILNYIKNYLYKDESTQEKKQRKRIIQEVSETASSLIYSLANKLGYNYFLSSLAKTLLDSVFDNKAQKQECTEVIKDYLSVEEEKMAICEKFSQLKTLNSVFILTEGVLYNKEEVISALRTIIKSPQDLEGFYKVFKEKNLKYVNQVVSDNSIDPSFTQEMHYKEIDFTRYGLVKLLISKNSPQRPLTDIDPIFNKVQLFSVYCKEKKIDNPFITTDIQNASSFDYTKGLYSQVYIASILTNNLEGNKKNIFSSDVFINYLRKIYLENKLGGLTKEFSLLNEDDYSKWILGYTDPALERQSKSSVLIGGNKALNSKVSFAFESDQYQDNKAIMYSGKNNTLLNRRIIALTDKKGFENKHVVKRNYYPGNNEPVETVIKAFEDNSLYMRKAINTTDIFMLPGSGNEIDEDSMDEQEKKIGMPTFYFNEIMGKVFLNKSDDEIDPFSQAVKLDKYIMNFTLQFREDFATKNSRNVISFEDAYEYPLIASMKYFNSSDYENKIVFKGYTPEEEEESSKSSSEESGVTEDNNDNNDFLSKSEESHDKEDPRIKDVFSLPFLNNRKLDQIKNRNTNSEDDSEFKDYDDDDEEADYFDTWVKIEPKSGLALSASLNFMYSMVIKPDDLFNFDSEKVIPVFFKSKKLSLGEDSVNTFLDNYLRDSFASSLLLFIGVGLCTFGVLMTIYAFFRPPPDMSFHHMPSNVSTYGAMAPDDDFDYNINKSGKTGDNSGSQSRDLHEKERASNLEDDGLYFKSDEN